MCTWMNLRIQVKRETIKDSGLNDLQMSLFLFLFLFFSVTDTVEWRHWRNIKQERSVLFSKYYFFLERSVDSPQIYPQRVEVDNAT